MAVDVFQTDRIEGAPSPTMQGFAAVCEQYGGELIEADDFYRAIFPRDTIEPRRREGADPNGHNGNPLILIQRKEKESYRHTKRILFSDYEWLTKWQSLSRVENVWMSGLTYLGKTRDLSHAVAMHAMIFDIDAVSPAGLENLLYGTATDIGFYPFPNYIVLSGNGVHLYYVFTEPIPLYHGKYGRKVKSQVNALKMALTRELWNPYTIDNYDKGQSPQYQGINQAFRLVGSPTKPLDEGKRYKVIAYKFPKIEPYEGLQPLYHFVKIPKEEQYRERSIYGVDYWKEKAPEWYERRIVKQDKSVKFWAMNRRLYEWWLKEVAEKARYGHRYNCLFCAVVYAVKCGVPKKEVEADLMKLIPILTSRKRGDPITAADVREALGAYSEALNTYPVKSIVYLSGIDIQKNAPRRNGRPQAEHLEEARLLQEFRHRRAGTDWREGNGRKPKQDIVKRWRQEHPEGKKVECERDLGLSRHTVLKWWD